MSSTYDIGSSTKKSNCDIESALPAEEAAAADLGSPSQSTLSDRSVAEAYRRRHQDRHRHAQYVCALVALLLLIVFVLIAFRSLASAISEEVSHRGNSGAEAATPVFKNVSVVDSKEELQRVLARDRDQGGTISDSSTGSGSGSGIAKRGPSPHVLARDQDQGGTISDSSTGSSTGSGSGSGIGKREASPHVLARDQDQGGTISDSSTGSSTGLGIKKREMSPHVLVRDQDQGGTIKDSSTGKRGLYSKVLTQDQDQAGTISDSSEGLRQSHPGVKSEMPLLARDMDEGGTITDSSIEKRFYWVAEDLTGLPPGGGHKKRSEADLAGMAPARRVRPHNTTALQSKLNPRFKPENHNRNRGKFGYPDCAEFHPCSG
ncbi:hypothetical protein EV356DRAFT_497791 [Viridothelium virens]|uniref:Transmembrane protein n=1 Tax=Viridothelium virens TaxID=1048519 RepID=A0A6A6HHD2_VIRVR|nr:hypothetical protein EV356DRAFT_497791 [Viridothelium virens]